MLKALPSGRYSVAYWKMVRPSIDYHVELFEYLYSVPYTLRSEVLDGRATATTVEIFHRGRRIASHLRSYRAGHTTLAEHMPSSHPDDPLPVEHVPQHPSTGAVFKNLERLHHRVEQPNNLDLMPKGHGAAITGPKAPRG